MKDNFERDQEICRLYSSGEENMPQLASRFNLSRPRVKQILEDYGITGRDEIEKRQSLLVSKIEDIISQEPDISTKQIAAKSGLKLRLVSYLIYIHKIKRDIPKVMSRVTTDRRRNERIVLTYDLLYRRYVVEQKPQKEIAEELGYTQPAISDNLRRLGITKRISVKKLPSTNKDEFR